MPKSRFLLIGCLLLYLSVYAQDPQNSRLNGKVTHLGLVVSDVHVMNLSAKTATITDGSGNFSILAQPRDTLLFSAVQLRRKSLIVTHEMVESQGIIVPLEEFVNELDEVVVRPYNLSGDISRDIAQMPGEKVVVSSTLGLPNAYVKPPTQAERKLYEATTGGGIVPINPVINAISGRTRYLKKILASERKYARTNRVREFYSDSLFIQDLRIPAARIDDFMYYCEVDSLFPREVDTADRLKIWEFLKRKSLDYRKINELE